MASSPRKLGCKLRQGVHHADKHVVRYASSHGSYQSRFTLFMIPAMEEPGRVNFDVSFDRATDRCRESMSLPPGPLMHASVH